MLIYLLLLNNKKMNDQDKALDFLEKKYGKKSKTVPSKEKPIPKLTEILPEKIMPEPMKDTKKSQKQESENLKESTIYQPLEIAAQSSNQTVFFSYKTLFIKRDVS